MFSPDPKQEEGNNRRKSVDPRARNPPNPRERVGCTQCAEAPGNYHQTSVEFQKLRSEFQKLRPSILEKHDFDAQYRLFGNHFFRKTIVLTRASVFFRQDLSKSFYILFRRERRSLS